MSLVCSDVGAPANYASEHNGAPWFLLRKKASDSADIPLDWLLDGAILIGF
jgi:hypothetical protein